MLQYEQGRTAIDNFVASMDGDRSRRTKWQGLAAELDEEVKIVKVKKNVAILSMKRRTVAKRPYQYKTYDSHMYYDYE